MSTRLNTDIKNDIKTKILKHRFEKEFQNLQKEYSEFSEKVYHDVYPEEIQQLMSTIPKSWLAYNGVIRVQFGGHFTYLSFSGQFQGNKYSIIQEEKLKLMPHYSGARKLYENNHKLSLEYSKLENKRKDLLNNFDKTSIIIQQTLNSFTSIEKLNKEWPESIEFTKDYRTKDKLPAIQIKTINEMLKL